MHSFFKPFAAAIRNSILAAALTAVLMPFLAHAESPKVEPLRIALHAAPHEVSPIVLTLSSDDPLLAESSPVLIPSDDSEMPPRQNPWHWVEVTGTFTGYVSQLKMGESNQPLASAPVLAAPDLDSPALMRAGSVADSLHVVGREGPFLKVRFRATLPLFVDFDAAPLKDDIQSVPFIADSDSTAYVPAVEDMLTPAISVEAISEEAGAEADVARVEPSPVVRILRGQLVSTREAGMRRAKFQHVIVSPAGRPLAYADLQFFRGSSLSSIIGKEGTFTGAVISHSNLGSPLPVMQVRTFRTP
jgi:hypothetical protein